MPVKNPQNLIISFSAKCSDLFSGTLQIDQEKYEIEGYVPHDIGIGGGDYIELKIDLRTGQILNWVPPSEDALMSVIEDAAEEDQYEDQRKRKTYIDKEDAPLCGPLPLLSYDDAIGSEGIDDLPDCGSLPPDYALSIIRLCEMNEITQLQKRDWIVARKYQGLEFIIMGPNDHQPHSVIGMQDNRIIWATQITPEGVTYRVLPEDKTFLHLAMAVLRSQGFK